MHIGIVGAGQLGRMMVLAGIPLGLRFSLYDPAESPPAAAVAPVTRSEFENLVELKRFAQGVDVVTFDWENVPVASVRAIAKVTGVSPPPRALEAAQDRIREKKLFERLGIDVAPYAAVDNASDLERAMAELGTPGLLKTRRLGYDGKGQAAINNARGANAALKRLGGVDLIYERRIDFEREVSLVGVRGQEGQVAFYALANNVHQDGILSVSCAPFVAPALQRVAERHLRRLLVELRYVGVLCVEFFVKDGHLIANEMAPRVHNSGHWTIEGARTSQFENHVRAVAGLPLGDTAARGHAVMVNLIGNMPPAASVLSQTGVHLHDYGKAPRMGRKLGHLTQICSSERERDSAAEALLRLAGRGPGKPGRGARVLALVT